MPDFTELSDVFALIDANGDGTLCADEVAEFCHSFKPDVPTDQLLELMGGPTVDVSAFCDVACKLESLTGVPQSTMVSKFADQCHKELFLEVDKDNSGEISRNELRHLIEAMELRLTDDDLRRIFAEVDTDGSGFIDADEFCGIMPRLAPGMPLSRFVSKFKSITSARNQTMQRNLGTFSGKVKSRPIPRKLVRRPEPEEEPPPQIERRPPRARSPAAPPEQRTPEQQQRSRIRTPTQSPVQEDLCAQQEHDQQRAAPITPVLQGHQGGPVAFAGSRPRGTSRAGTLTIPVPSVPGAARSRSGSHVSKPMPGPARSRSPSQVSAAAADPVSQTLTSVARRASYAERTPTGGRALEAPAADPMSLTVTSARPEPAHRPLTPDQLAQTVRSHRSASPSADQLAQTMRSHRSVTPGADPAAQTVRSITPADQLAQSHRSVTPGADPAAQTVRSITPADPLSQTQRSAPGTPVQQTPPHRPAAVPKGNTAKAGQAAAAAAAPAAAVRNGSSVTNGSDTRAKGAGDGPASEACAAAAAGGDRSAAKKATRCSVCEKLRRDLKQAHEFLTQRDQIIRSRSSELARLRQLVADLERGQPAGGGVTQQEPCARCEQLSEKLDAQEVLSEARREAAEAADQEMWALRTALELRSNELEKLRTATQNFASSVAASQPELIGVCDQLVAAVAAVRSEAAKGEAEAFGGMEAHEVIADASTKRQTAQECIGNAEDRLADVLSQFNTPTGAEIPGPIAGIQSAHSVDDLFGQRSDSAAAVPPAPPGTFKSDLRDAATSDSVAHGYSQADLLATAPMGLQQQQQQGRRQRQNRSRPEVAQTRQKNSPRQPAAQSEHPFAPLPSTSRPRFSQLRGGALPEGSHGLTEVAALRAELAKRDLRIQTLGSKLDRAQEAILAGVDSYYRTPPRRLSSMTETDDPSQRETSRRRSASVGPPIRSASGSTERRWSSGDRRVRQATDRSLSPVFAQPPGLRECRAPPYASTGACAGPLALSPQRSLYSAPAACRSISADAAASELRSLLASASPDGSVPPLRPSLAPQLRCRSPPRPPLRCVTLDHTVVPAPSGSPAPALPLL
eukprot:TRINITY_DN3789_c0_g2_i2.p1 TRINITY_DN3789_c0_g2~~TRINITY_DN3789_c0_g2_i2.p1  ORF type:complete len:1081 (+),score=15.14 TRINITY_DN3789_c0_g2_i2:89-3331(+)